MFGLQFQCIASSISSNNLTFPMLQSVNCSLSTELAPCSAVCCSIAAGGQVTLSLCCSATVTLYGAAALQGHPAPALARSPCSLQSTAVHWLITQTWSSPEFCLFVCLCPVATRPKLLKKNRMTLSLSTLFRDNKCPLSVLDWSYLTGGD